jgi:hypothetical protein
MQPQFIAMSNFDLADFLPQDRQTAYEKWASSKEFNPRLEAEFGISADEPMHRIPFKSDKKELSGFLQPEITWMYIPGDSVSRLSSADDVLSMFFTIVAETLENFIEAGYDLISWTEEVLDDEIEYSTRDVVLWTISHHAKQPFRGKISDPQTIFSDNVSASEPQGEPSNPVNSIFIEKVVNNPTGRLARDIVKYDITESDQVFGSEFGVDFELMIRRILNADLEPTDVNYCVEFEGRAYNSGELGIFTGL